MPQHFDGAANVGAVELDAARRRVAQTVAQHALGFRVRDERNDILAIGAGRRRSGGISASGTSGGINGCLAIRLLIGTTFAMPLSGSSRTLSFLERSRAAAACWPSL